MSPHITPRVALLAALLAAAPAAQAQSSSEASRVPEDGRVIGVVIDENSDAPVQGALVFLSDGRTTQTDGEGRFTFLHVRPGDHQIAAVTRGCAKVEGGFSVAEGADSRIRLEVAVPGAPFLGGKEKGQGTSMTLIEGKDLEDHAERSLWNTIEREVPFFLERSPQGPRVRNGRVASLRSSEPLLVLDGVRVQGDIYRVLSSITTGEVARVEIHRGAAGGWEYGYGGESGVIEVTTRTPAGTPDMVVDRPAESCVKLD